MAGKNQLPDKFGALPQKSFGVVKTFLFFPHAALLSRPENKISAAG
jgi:hypothetical protein